MLVSGHKVQSPQGPMNLVTVVDPSTGAALTMTDREAEALAEQLKSVSTRLRLEVGN